MFEKRVRLHEVGGVSIPYLVFSVRVVNGKLSSSSAAAADQCPLDCLSAAETTRETLGLEKKFPLSAQPTIMAFLQTSTLVKKFGPFVCPKLFFPPSMI